MGPSPAACSGVGVGGIGVGVGGGDVGVGGTGVGVGVGPQLDKARPTIRIRETANVSNLVVLIVLSFLML
jgi:hypothetical protein